MKIFEIRKFGEAEETAPRNMRWVRAAVHHGPLMDLLGAIAIPLLLLYGPAADSPPCHDRRPVLCFPLRHVQCYMPLKRTGYSIKQLQAVSGTAPAKRLPGAAFFLRRSR